MKLINDDPDTEESGTWDTYGKQDVPDTVPDMVPNGDIGYPVRFSRTGKLVDSRVRYRPDRQLSTFGLVFRLQFRQIMAFSIDLCKAPGNTAKSMQIRLVCAGERTTRGGCAADANCGLDDMFDCTFLKESRETRINNIMEEARVGEL